MLCGGETPQYPIGKISRLVALELEQRHRLVEAVGPLRAEDRRAPLHYQQAAPRCGGRRAVTDGGSHGGGRHEQAPFQLVAASGDRRSP